MLHDDDDDDHKTTTTLRLSFVSFDNSPSVTVEISGCYASAEQAVQQRPPHTVFVPYSRPGRNEIRHFSCLTSYSASSAADASES